MQPPAPAPAATLASAERLARAAIARHLPEGWSFAWLEDRPACALRRGRSAARGTAPRRILGRCDGTAREIQISRRHALTASAADVWETILHEIAHALAFSCGDYGHGQIWADFCDLLGIGAHGRAYSAECAARAA